MANAGLLIRNIGKRYGSQTALDEVDLAIAPGEFFSLLGPSGCGKSTLLRIIAGLESADGGEILWNGRRMDQLAARERPFNMVFQRYALFPHLNVFDNIAFGLKLKKRDSTRIKAEVEEVLELVGLSGFGARWPETLSGGQAQRVALARALVNKPEILLLDEPLSALDQKMRERMQAELRELQRRLGLTFIFVTHDQEEAMILSDRIAVMNGGRIEQVNEPRVLYSEPRSRFTARFIGHMNELNGRLASHVPADLGPQTQSQALRQTPCAIALESHPSKSTVIQGRLAAARNGCGASGTIGVGSPVSVFIRPEHLRVLAPDEEVTTGFNSVKGELLQIVFRGTLSEALVKAGSGLILRALLPELRTLASERTLGPGARVQVEFPADAAIVFPTPGSET